MSLEAEMKMHDALDSLAATALRVKAERDELLKACKEVWRMFEQGYIVRDTSKDYKSDWAVKQLPLIRALGMLQAAIAKAEDGQ